MNSSFGIVSRPVSTRWVDVRRGPTIEAVRSHIFKVTHFNGRFARTR